jgi:hypothetical protein
MPFFLWNANRIYDFIGDVQSVGKRIPNLCCGILLALYSRWHISQPGTETLDSLSAHFGGL